MVQWLWAAENMPVVLQVCDVSDSLFTCCNSVLIFLALIF